jgi:hypothetical protein
MTFHDSNFTCDPARSREPSTITKWSLTESPVGGTGTIMLSFSNKVRLDRLCVRLGHSNDTMRILENILLSARNGRRTQLDQVNWDDSGGFFVTPTATGKSGGWSFTNSVRSRSAPSVVFAKYGKQVLNSGSGLLIKRNHQPQSQRHNQHPSNAVLQQEGQHQNKPGNMRSTGRQSRIRRKQTEQIPDEMRVRIVYGGGATAGGTTGGGTTTPPAAGRRGTGSDAATVTTCTTAGRSSIRTTEPDRLTKRAMAQAVLLQLMDKEAIANVKKPDPEEEERRSDDKIESDLDQQESPTSGLDFLWSCCGGKCSSSTEEVLSSAPELQHNAADNRAALEPPLLTPTTAVTDNRSVFTGSTTIGSSYTGTDDSSTWLSNSIQSSLSSTEGWW